MPKQLSYAEWCEAYKEATHQKDCYADQVSGVWSISGDEFCKKYHLDYDDAANYELDNVVSATEDYYDEELARITGKIGALTDEQKGILLNKIQEECTGEEEAFHFWNHLCWQLAKEYPEYQDKLDEEE